VIKSILLIYLNFGCEG